MPCCHYHRVAFYVKSLPRNLIEAVRARRIALKMTLREFSKSIGRNVWTPKASNHWNLRDWRRLYRTPVPPRSPGQAEAELRLLRVLEDENRKLKKLVADRALDMMVLKELLQKNPEAQGMPFRHA